MLIKLVYNLTLTLKLLLTLSGVTTANVRSLDTRPRPTSGSACPLNCLTPSGHPSTITALMTVLNGPCSLILLTTVFKILRKCIELSGSSTPGSGRQRSNVQYHKFAIAPSLSRRETAAVQSNKYIILPQHLSFYQHCPLQPLQTPDPQAQG